MKKTGSAPVSFREELNPESEAATVCQRALLRFPESSGLHNQLGKSWLAEGKQARAKKESELAVSLNPANEEAADFLRHSFRSFAPGNSFQG